MDEGMSMEPFERIMTKKNPKYFREWCLNVTFSTTNPT
jgi:hypothetical protein